MGLTSKIGTDVKTGTGILEIRVLHIISFSFVCEHMFQLVESLNLSKLYKFQFYVEEPAVTGMEGGSVQREIFHNRIGFTFYVYLHLCLLSLSINESCLASACRINFSFYR